MAPNKGHEAEGACSQFNTPKAKAILQPPKRHLRLMNQALYDVGFVPGFDSVTA